MDRLKRTVVVLSSVLVTSGVVVDAGAERARDGNDARGPFDLATLEQTKRDGDRLRFVLTTHAGWKVDRVRSGGFAIRVDSDKDRDFDRFVLIEWQNSPGPGGRLRARIVLPTGETIRREPAHHRKPRRLSVWLDRNDLGITPGTFQVNAYSVFYADWCPDDGCRDEIPNRGRLPVGFGGDCHGRDPDITGTGDHDRITTRGHRVVVVGLGGDDIITVDRGSAIVCAGAGRDLLTGGNSADILSGEGGNDEIRLKDDGRRANEGYGGPGSDLLYGGGGSDRLFGQAHDDYLDGRRGDDYLDGGRGRDDLRGGPGTDTCVEGQSTGGC